MVTGLHGHNGLSVVAAVVLGTRYALARVTAQLRKTGVCHALVQTNGHNRVIISQNALSMAHGLNGLHGLPVLRLVALVLPKGCELVLTQSQRMEAPTALVPRNSERYAILCLVPLKVVRKQSSPQSRWVVTLPMISIAKQCRMHSRPRSH